jgi:D-arabinose 1-dehydrogenase-like Zn-dependent alcohol dehydrogenase
MPLSMAREATWSKWVVKYSRFVLFPARLFSGYHLTLQQVGGIISIYGMTVSPKMDFLMSAVLRNIEVRGSTMGSRKEFADMVQFVKEKKMRPVVSRSVQGLDIDKIETLFDDMKSASQFGKLVVVLGQGKQSKL